MYNVLSGLHRQLAECDCVLRGAECGECAAACRALAELEKWPAWRAMSEAMERDDGDHDNL